MLSITNDQWTLLLRAFVKSSFWIHWEVKLYFFPRKNSEVFHQKKTQNPTVTTMKTKLRNLSSWWIVLISNQEIITLWLAYVMHHPCCFCNSAEKKLHSRQGVVKSWQYWVTKHLWTFSTGIKISQIFGRRIRYISVGIEEDKEIVLRCCPYFIIEDHVKMS